MLQMDVNVWIEIVTDMMWVGVEVERRQIVECQFSGGPGILPSCSCSLEMDKHIIVGKGDPYAVRTYVR